MRLVFMRNHRFFLKIVCVLAILLLIINFININRNGPKFEDDLLNNPNLSDDNEIVCLILTSEKTMGSKGLAVWHTWGRQCSKIYFSCNCKNIIKYQEMYKNKEKMPESFIIYDGLHDIPILLLNIEENYNKMGEKAFLIMKIIYEQLGTKAKWFLMADDDTFIFMDNLRKFIQTKDTQKPELFGFRFRAMFSEGFIAGGSGILFTHESMKRLVNLIQQDKCRKDMYSDISIAECALQANITIGNSHDKMNKPRFHPANPKIHFHGPIPGALLSSGSHDGTVGKNCCSNESIGFHWIEPSYMREIYRNKTFLNDLFG